MGEVWTLGTRWGRILLRPTKWRSEKQRSPRRRALQKTAGFAELGFGRETGAGSAHNHDIRLHRISTCRRHRFSTNSKLCEAWSGHTFWATPTSDSGPFPTLLYSVEPPGAGPPPRATMWAFFSFLAKGAVVKMIVKSKISMGYSRRTLL